MTKDLQCRFPPKPLLCHLSNVSIIILYTLLLSCCQIDYTFLANINAGFSTIFAVVTLGCIRERSLFMGGGASANRGGGHKFQCKQIEGGKISVQAFRGGGKISVHRHLKANLRQQKYTLKIFAAYISIYYLDIHANFALSGFT